MAAVRRRSRPSRFAVKRFAEFWVEWPASLIGRWFLWSGGEVETRRAGGRRYRKTESKSWPRSAKIRLAAFRPGAIETPAPGCDSEPHRYTFSTGER